MLKIATIH